MLLPLTDNLLPCSPFDADCAALADRHYSRQTIGSPQFVGNGRKLVLRDTVGDVVFAWLWAAYRADGEQGYNCTIFRNESARRSSDIILEAEEAAVAEVGARASVHLHRSDTGAERQSRLLLQMRGVAIRSVQCSRQAST